MQNIVWKLLLIAGVLGLCTLSVVVKELRLGRDLRGGVSLVYKVNIDPDEPNPQEVLARTITVLKDRVNPKGVFDISMQPLGRDRLEISMPLPNQEVRQLQDAYTLALADLLERSEIAPNDLDESLRRGAAPAEMGGDADTERGRAVADLQAAYDARDAAQSALADGSASGAPDEEIRRLEFAVAGAELAYEALYEEVLGMSLGESRVRRTLNLPTAPISEKDAQGRTVTNEDGSAVMGPSQRDIAVEQLTLEYPHLAAGFQQVLIDHDAYQSRRTGFDDPEDLKRLLRGAGVLEFRIGVQASDATGVDIADLRTQLSERGPENTISPVAKWFAINELKQWYEEPEQLQALEADPVGYFSSTRNMVAAVYEGGYYLLLHVTDQRSMQHGGEREWQLTGTFPTQDSLGRPAVAFSLDSSGAALMGRLTGGNIGKPMAIVLDGEVYSAPTIQGQITSNGQITGNFAQAEVNYLIRVLAAGSLQARLSPEPISMSVLGPSIGADNLSRGKEAFIISIIAVAVFMLVYYFFAGVVAVIALAANGIIIFGVMIGIDGTFTLPGMAGIVLTIGMAVDANVLIYERIREELFAGELDLKGAIREGYAKALSTILDANITNLIVCFVLFYTATTEVKGFALTLTIGICATLFTALFVTRQLFYLYTDVFKADRLEMLPTAVPAIHRALEPSINWIGMRKIFWAISTVAVVGSIVLVSSRGVNMFDTEFRGGVSANMLTRVTAPDDDGDGEPQRLLLRHTGSADSVEDRIHAIGEAADPGAAASDGERDRARIIAELANASVLTVGRPVVDEDGNVRASEFQIKVASPKGLDDERTITEVIVKTVVDEFGADLDITPALAFNGSDEPDSSGYVFPIDEDELGANINRPGATQRVPEFLGGAAIVIDGMSPPVMPQDVERRIERMRNQPDFQTYSGRRVRAIGLTPADPSNRDAGYTGFVVLVYDEYRSFLRIDAEVWFREVADVEWNLVRRALTQPASLEQFSTFSPAVAETLAAQAIVAVVLTLLGILVYIWVRFGSLRYSLAAIVALVHDVTISLGLLAATGWIGATVFGATLLIEPFRIDLGVVAALLTIIGYSLNDTIVILDRVRENRGKRPLATAAIVNRSINQTVSRTLLTSVTTLVAVLIMYIEGGSGIRPFTFCLLIGLLVGTYSSVAIAAPLVFFGGEDDGHAAEGAVGQLETDLPEADALGATT